MEYRSYKVFSSMYFPDVVLKALRYAASENQRFYKYEVVPEEIYDDDDRIMKNPNYSKADEWFLDRGARSGEVIMIDRY